MSTQIAEKRIQNSLNINDGFTLVKVSELNSEELLTVKSMFLDCEPIGWDSESSMRDKELANQFNFDIEACVVEDDFVMFNFPRSEGHPLVEFINKKLNVESIGSLIFCDTFFAHIHNDQEAVSDSGQLMIVVENNESHLLYSVNSDGIEYSFAPKSGDIVFLNIWEDHAVFPNQKNGMAAVRENPMKLVCFN